MKKTHNTRLASLLAWLDWIFINPFRQLSKWISQLWATRSQPSIQAIRQARFDHAPIAAKRVNAVFPETLPTTPGSSHTTGSSALKTSHSTPTQASQTLTRQANALPLNPGKTPSTLSALSSAQPGSEGALIQAIRQAKSAHAPQAEVTQLVNRLKQKMHERASATKLICIDFDETITLTHLHALLTQSEIQTPYKGQGVTVFHPGTTTVDAFPACKPLEPAQMTQYESHCMTQAEKCELNEPEKMAHLIRTALQNNHRVAITSFTSYPHTIPFVLKRLKLTPAEIKDIIIVSGIPTTITQTADKTAHIRQAQQCTTQGASNKSFIIPDNNILLIDDAHYNIKKAKEKGFAGLVAKAGNMPFKEAFAFIEKPAFSANINPDGTTPQIVLRKRGG